MDWEKIALGLYGLLFGIGKWYFAKLDKRVETNAEEINQLKTDLALNKQSDEQVQLSIKKIEQSLVSIDKHLRKYDFVLEKALKKEME